MKPIVITVVSTSDDHHAQVVGTKTGARSVVSGEQAALRAAAKVFGRAKPFTLHCQEEPVVDGAPGRYTATPLAKKP